MSQSIGPLFIALFVIASINISTFPYVYNGNGIICEIMGFIRVYSGLSNVLLVGMMVQIYRNLFVDDRHDWTAFINKYVEYIAFVIPLITILPFSMHMYSGEAGTWCAEPLYTWVQILWFWMVSLLWTYIVILYSIVALSRTLYTVYRADPEMASKLVKTIGLYAVVSLIVWFFLVGSSFRTFEHAYSNLIVYLCGILYFAIFLSEKKSLKLLERFMAVNDVDCSQNDSIGEGGSRLPACFSWEEDDESVSVARRSRHDSTHSHSTTVTSSRSSSRPSGVFDSGSGMRLSRLSSILMLNPGTGIRNSEMGSPGTSTGNPVHGMNSERGSGL